MFIERARTYDAVESTTQAFQAAKAFGKFQEDLADLPPPPLHVTLPGFHDTPKRFAAFEQAVEADAAGRVRLAGPEIEFVRRRKPIAGVLLELHRQGEIPERTTHNDTKLNNVMLDDATHEGICVIDLDTVMPGLALYDFGDMVRTTTNPAFEDERDLIESADANADVRGPGARLSGGRRPFPQQGRAAAPGVRRQAHHPGNRPSFPHRFSLPATSISKSIAKPTTSTAAARSSSWSSRSSRKSRP